MDRQTVCSCSKNNVCAHYCLKVVGKSSSPFIVLGFTPFGSYAFHLVGFNSTLRRVNLTHHEYIQVEKGRDVGLNQISLFEAKVACGNGEQTLSRDVYRYCFEGN